MLKQQLKNYLQESKHFKNRVLKASILIAILIAFLIIRLFSLQIFNYKLYANLATKNQLEHLPIEPNRGLIYDRNGILLAENLPIFSLNIITEHTKNIKNTLANLKTIIGITPNDIKQFQKALQHHHRFEHIPIKLKLTQEEVANFYVNQDNFPGVCIDTQMIRHYPLAKENVAVLGYVGRINRQDLKNIDINNYNASKFIGKVGIEKYYENALRGKIGYKISEVDARGHIVRTLKIIPPTPGDSLYLTIDSKLQKVAQDALDKERGAVVAIDPNNGEILTLVSNPTYDSNLFTNGIDSTTFNELQFSNAKPMYNRAAKSIFPFGSTIKPFIALQGLDTGIITLDSKISDPGWFKLEKSKQIYRDWIHNGHGTVNVTKAITESCNTFFYILGVKLGIEKIDSILERFGFGDKINIDILEESTGIVASPKNKMTRTGKHWYTGDTINSSIGQGDMKTTLLQLASAVGTIAMHGQRLQPHLLYIIQKPNGNKIQRKIVPLPSVTLKNTKNWDIVINAMKNVVMNPTGTAYNRFGSNLSYTIAGKTGGAQLYHHKIVNENPTPESEEHIPKHLRNHNLFIAFAPIENPKIAIAVVTENSNKAVKIARKVLDYYFTEVNSVSEKQDTQ
ncbi:MAG: penicillin-binding protein 2 [Coxiellaceae bacterium]|jgi:penicillin-binding protein 2|nr:penicillin-binding protein 2 [Coxiellaceae bacterium]